MIVTEFNFTQKASSPGNGNSGLPIPKNAIDALKQAAVRRVDMVMMSDSNGLNGGYGFDSGFQWALSQNYQMYATGIQGANQLGFGMGYLYDRHGQGMGATTGAPTPQASKWFTTVDGANQYAYLTPGQTLDQYNGTINTYVGCPINLSDRLTAHFVYGEWGSGGASFQPSISDGTTRVAAPVTSTTGVDGRLVDLTIDYPAGTRNGGVNLYWYDGTSQNLSGGSFIAYYARLENPGRKVGFSVSSLFSVGGRSMKDFAYFLHDSSDSSLISYFTEIRKLQIQQGYAPLVVLYLNTGVNDGGSTNAAPTLGPRALGSGGSVLDAYVDNFEYVLYRVQTLWLAQGWNLSELYFLLIASHVTGGEVPVGNFDMSKLVPIRAYCKKWQRRANVQFIDTTDYFNFSAMSSGLWYDLGDNGGAGPSIHMSPAGYNGVALKLIEQA